MATWALAQLDLALGRWPEALERLEVMADVRPGHGDALLAVIAVPDTIEAAVRAGRLERRSVAAARVRGLGGGVGRGLGPARAWRGFRALLADGDEATAHFEEALERCAEDAAPLRPGPHQAAATASTCGGSAAGRTRGRTCARRSRRFERLGAAPWAERARAELRGDRRDRRASATRPPSAQLTPQERQVARFVAQGLSNKEVAAQLYLSPRTIDAHLRNAFAKLGVTSRTQLARMELEEGA